MSTLAASPAPTLDDILRLFFKADRKIQDTDRMLKERAVDAPSTRATEPARFQWRAQKFGICVSILQCNEAYMSKPR